MDPKVINRTLVFISILKHFFFFEQGIGALFVRRKPRVRLEPVQSGGGQERGLRSGTVPTPLVVGFGEACKIAKNEMEVSKIFIYCRIIFYTPLVAFIINL